MDNLIWAILFPIASGGALPSMIVTKLLVHNHADAGVWVLLSIIFGAIIWVALAITLLTACYVAAGFLIFNIILGIIIVLTIML